MNAPRMVKGTVVTVFTAAVLSGVIGASLSATPPGLGSGPLRTTWTTGACHQLAQPWETAFAYVSDTKDPVDCARPHTTETFEVVKLTGHLAQAQERPSYVLLQRAGEHVCSKEKFDEYLGATSLDAVWGLNTIRFFPSAREWKRGERRVRCDVTTSHEEMAAPQVLKRPIKNVYTATDASRWRVCRWHGDQVPCAEDHGEELIGPRLPFSKDQVAKGRTYMKQATRQFCESRVSAYIGEPLSKRPDLEFSAEVEVPSESARSKSSRVGLCWVGPVGADMLFQGSLRKNKGEGTRA
ncbi:septum formation family protein [Streptomyces melanogenes]|uniref:septum formation family protein n=1 Tax=Streptomyces melanogenes TaxID=67326 RepID=UPI00167D3AEB|nr:septum formation family protein [Streptomyces melanogenes]GGP86490.1 hypothetical protein GCM10010278_76230 [Streptomyces melanogenes]